MSVSHQTTTTIDVEHSSYWLIHFQQRSVIGTYTYCHGRIKSTQYYVEYGIVYYSRAYTQIDFIRFDLVGRTSFLVDFYSFTNIVQLS